MFLYIPILLQQWLFPFNWPPALAVFKPAHGPQGSPLLRGASLMMQTVQTIQRPLWTSESPKVPGKSPSNHAHKANKHTHTNDKHRYSMNFHDPANFTQVVLLLWSTLYVSALSSCYFEVVVQESRACYVYLMYILVSRCAFLQSQFCQVSAMAKDPTACSAVDLSTMVYQQNPDGNVHCHKEWPS